MCLIIDINVFHKFLDENDGDLKELHKLFFKPQKNSKKVFLVYGGKLRDEYKASTKIARAIIALDRAGKAKAIDDKSVLDETDRVEKLKLCVSDDQHIIGLARISNTRLLCSHDKDLHTDFKNNELLDNPRGRVYQNVAHHHLIDDFC